jgi:adenylate kinase
VTTNARNANGRARVILFLGAPGSGKGTQSSRLSSRLRLSCLSTGEILRSEAKRNTPAGFRLRRVLASGSLVSDETVCSVVESRLRREVLDAGLILDGFPRTVEQAAYLDSLLSRLGLPRPMVVHLHVSQQGLLRRLTARRHCASCGAIYNLISRPSLGGLRCESDGGALVERDDDAEGVVLRRLAEFDHMSAPLIEYYSGPDYHRMDGDRDPDSIARDLLEIVQPREMCAPAYGD